MIPLDNWLYKLIYQTAVMNQLAKQDNVLKKQQIFYAVFKLVKKGQT